MQIHSKITIITLGLTLASLSLDSLLAQETLSCYMINASGEVVNLVGLCEQESRITPPSTNTRTPAPDQQSNNDIKMIPVTRSGDNGQTEPVTDNLDFNNDSKMVNPRSFEGNLRGLRRTQETLDSLQDKNRN